MEEPIVVPVAGPGEESRAQGRGRRDDQAGAVPAVGEAIDPLEFAVDGCGEGKGIQSGAQALQGAEVGRSAAP